ncbi:MAG: alpha-galactosidase [Ignavibacteriae bacterium]|nr:alpha-galactosidase [Ignavibacteriota bacterium]MCB9208977.1 alpha-galactosidase [Ignavibacteriales bacterium]MCB9218102.1 alpha-galactosidase [Ignavibacteriales bacterium]
MIKSKFILILIFIISSHTILAGENEKEIFKYSNNLFTKKFYSSTSEAGKIFSELEHFDSNIDIPTSTGKPLFEFYVNKTKVNSESEIWSFKDYSERKLKNGGVEFKINFSAIKGPINGLNISLVQQLFPNSTLVREKLILWTERESEYFLNKLNDKIHFNFPINYFNSESDQILTNTEIRIASWEEKPITFGNKTSGNHMFYPKINETILSNEVSLVKGPINLISNGKQSLFTTYEHASQDNINGMFDETKKGKGKLIVDAMQGTKGVFNFEINDEDFWFLGIENSYSNNLVTSSVKALRGAYLDGEIIDKNHPYESVWTATAYYEGSSIEEGKRILRNYLLNQINENLNSRKPEFYYNTWGMQRNSPGDSLRSILNYERIFKEIEYASEMGVDIFVLDDGWEETQGIWTPNKKRLKDGLAPIKEKLDEHNMKMGLWFSPMGIDTSTKRYKLHQDWVIKDSEGNPIKAQWGHPAFDFVSDFSELFIEDCKKLIDQGCSFMKWDAINTFYSDLPNLHHGDSNYTSEERRARYEYLLPIYVTKAMETLLEYDPNLIIEIDLTEARRVMAGLAPISQGKLFWMNNGASTYNDYSTYRTKSMRTIANEFAGIIPWELFTYASYPHNIKGSMEYNLNSSILSGHGFWGNLDLMNSADRKYIGEKVKTAKSILEQIIDVNPKVNGRVGDSPEIYSIVNNEKGIGQIISFTDEPIKYDYCIKINPEKVFTVLNTPYSIVNDSLKLNLNFTLPESSINASILPNENNQILITNSHVPIIFAEFKNDKLQYQVKGKGQQTMYVNRNYGLPKIKNQNSELNFSVKDDYYIIDVTNNVPDEFIEIDLEK